MAWWIETGIGQPIVHRIESRRPGIGEPCHLYPCGLACKGQGPTAGHVHGQVDQHVDAVGAYQGGQCPVVQLLHFMPAIRVGRDHPGEVIRTPDIGVAKDFKVAVVVVREQRHEEQRLTVIAKIGRDIADSQAPDGFARAGRGRARPGNGGRPPLIPAPCFGQNARTVE
jgi:hypothetical protein